MALLLCPRFTCAYRSGYANRRKSGGGTSQAKEILTQARLKFPKEYRIAYNLACYGCPLGNRKQAMQDLEEAFDLLQ
jgi:hypothetical protein